MCLPLACGSDTDGTLAHGDNSTVGLIVAVGCALRHRPESRPGLEFSLGGPRPFGSWSAGLSILWRSRNLACPGRSLFYPVPTRSVCHFLSIQGPVSRSPRPSFLIHYRSPFFCDIFYLTTFRFLIDQTFPPVYIPSCWVRSRIGPVLPFYSPRRHITITTTTTTITTILL